MTIGDEVGAPTVHQETAEGLQRATSREAALLRAAHASCSREVASF